MTGPICYAVRCYQEDGSEDSHVTTWIQATVAVCVILALSSAYTLVKMRTNSSAELTTVVPTTVGSACDWAFGRDDAAVMELTRLERHTVGSPSATLAGVLPHAQQLEWKGDDGNVPPFSVSLSVDAEAATTSATSRGQREAFGSGNLPPAFSLEAIEVQSESSRETPHSFMSARSESDRMGANSREHLSRASRLFIGWHRAMNARQDDFYGWMAQYIYWCRPTVLRAATQYSYEDARSPVDMGDVLHFLLVTCFGQFQPSAMDDLPIHQQIWWGDLPQEVLANVAVMIGVESRIRTRIIRAGFESVPTEVILQNVRRSLYSSPGQLIKRWAQLRQSYAAAET